MSGPRLDRYRRGDRVGVWRDLVALGAAVRDDEAVLDDARAVAQATMERAAHNVGVIVERLGALGYRFAFPEEVWRRPDATSLRRLDELERRCGPLPLSLRGWYEVVGSVNLMGAHPKVSMYSDLDWGGSDRFWNLRWYTDPLVVFPADVEDNVDDVWFDDEFREHPAPPFTLWLAPDALHKANISGGEAMKVRVPDPAADAPLLGSDWPGVPFVDYLRTCFAWGGFPGFVRPSPHPMGNRPGDLEPYRAVVDFLRRDLLVL